MLKDGKKEVSVRKNITDLRKNNGKNFRTHGLSHTKIYEVWHGMIQRCTNSNATHYKDYGGRGITVCQEWKNNFINFYNDMFEDYKEGLQIERKENNKGYYKSNCTWATIKEQSINRRTTRYVIYLEEKYCISDLAKKLKIRRNLVYQRLFRGKTIQMAFETNEVKEFLQKGENKDGNKN